MTAVCSTNKVELARSLGADQVIDYTKQDFTRGGQRYDVILDVAANRSLFATRRVLTTNGIQVGVGAAGGGRRMVPILVRILAGAALSRLGSQKVITFMAKNSTDDLLALTKMIEAGKVSRDRRTYPSARPPAMPTSIGRRPRKDRSPLTTASCMRSAGPTR